MNELPAELLILLNAIIAQEKQSRMHPLVLTEPHSVSHVFADIQKYMDAHRMYGADLEALIIKLEALICTDKTGCEADPV